MSHSWPLVLLRDVLTPVSRPKHVDPEKTYKILGAHWYATGLYIKDTLLGSEIRADKVYKVESGDFVYNRLFAWKGSFAVANKADDGCYVSNEFPCFAVSQEHLDPSYLWRYFSRSCTWDEALELSSGGTPTSRNRLKEERFLALRIPLPPLPEQRRIVARIEDLAAKINEGQLLRQRLTEETHRLLVCMAHRRDLDENAKLKKGWHRIALAGVMQLVDNSRRVNANESYPNLGIYSFGRGLFHKPPIDGSLTSATMLRRVRKGQFVYSRLFAFEGAYGFVTDEFDGCFVSNEYPTFECDASRARAEFVAAYFNSPAVWKEVASGSKGLGDRRQRVQPERVLSHTVWLPPLEWQEQIARVQKHVSALKRLQSETATELDAMLPSILDKAFKGDL